MGDDSRPYFFYYYLRQCLFLELPKCICMKKIALSTLLVVCSYGLFAQQSNIQAYTPSKLLKNGQWDIKWFNNLYTEVKSSDSKGKVIPKLRNNFFTSTIDIFRGISESRRVNVGLLVEIRSNTIAGRAPLSVFSFDERAGITTIAPSIKIQPFQSIGNLSIQSSLHIPLVKTETVAGVFLDQTAWAFQNRLFYDKTFNDGKWQIFSGISLEYGFGSKQSFANNTFLVSPEIFLSYFPSSKSTLLVSVQHAQRFGDFTQNYTAVGGGAKYQLSEVLNMEVLYTNFIRGNDNGLGQTFNIGLRALF